MGIAVFTRIPCVVRVGHTTPPQWPAFSAPLTSKFGGAWVTQTLDLGLMRSRAVSLGPPVEKDAPRVSQRHWLPSATPSRAEPQCALPHQRLPPRSPPLWRCPWRIDGGRHGWLPLSPSSVRECQGASRPVGRCYIAAGAVLETECPHLSASVEPAVNVQSGVLTGAQDDLPRCPRILGSIVVLEFDPQGA